MDPVYGYEAVNVEAQSRSLSSFLSATKRLISVRKSTPAFGRGSMTFIRPANRAVLAYVRQYKDEVILCVANLSRAAQATELDLSAWKDRIPLEMLGRTRFPAIGELPYTITLTSYGFYWFQLLEREKSEPPPVRALTEFVTLVVPRNSTSMSLVCPRGVFEREVLPGYLARSRWFPERDQRKIQPTLVAAMSLCDIGDKRPWLTFFEANVRGVPARHLLPLQIDWVRFDRERHNPRAIAAVRQGAHEGTLLEVAQDHAFIALFLRNLQRSLTIDGNGLRLQFKPTGRFSVREIREPERVRAVETEQSNSTALVDADYVVKLYRKLEAGINPEIEMSRFLTEDAEFANTPALLGSCELVEGEQYSAIAVVHAFVQNQGDGWTITSGYLDRFVDEQRLLATGEQPSESEQLPPYLRLISQTGRRLAEMHLALASRDDLPDFAPDPVRPEDVATWTGGIRARAEHIFEAFTKHPHVIRDADLPLVDQLLTLKDRLELRLGALLPTNVVAQKIRHHGDFHLGQMLIAKDDVFIIDFEGEPRRSFAERRRKVPAARDVAGLIRSLDYSVMAALGRTQEAGADEAGRLGIALELWRDQSIAAFLAAYRETINGSPVWPADQVHADKLLKFFLLEKALYEVEYELAYRPNWLRVPLKGTIQILFEDEGKA
jgi:maltose alpha-D-glucosyltransferase/alpha-amylase